MSRCGRSVRLRSLVLRELTHLLVVMRRNRKWKSSARDLQTERTSRSPFTLIAHMDELRWSLTAPDTAADAAETAGLALDRAALIDPFLALVTSPETNGHITCLALSAVERLVIEGVLDPTPAEADAAAAASVSSAPVFDAAPIHSVVHALTHCRFEPSDSSRDEVVLARLLSLSRAVLFSPAGSFLSNRAVWRLLQNLYAVHAQLHMRGAGGGGEHYSQVLAEQAEQTMVDLVTRVAQQVNEQIERERADISSAPTVPAVASVPSSVAAAAHSLASFAASGSLQIPSSILHPSASPSAPAYPPSHHMSPTTTAIPQSFDNIPAVAAPSVAATSRPAEVTPPPASAAPLASSPPLSCRTPLIFNSASSNPNLPQHAYGLPVLRKVFELVASLCESVHTDLNVALKIDLVHGVHGEGTRQLEQEHAAATAAQAAAAAARAAEAAEEERNDTANTNTAATATDTTSVPPSVEPSPRPLSPSPTSPLLTPAPPTVTPAPPAATEGPSASPAPASAASSPFPPSTLPPYSSASYRCLLPISELSTLGFFALPLPGVASNGGGHHHVSSSLGQSLVSSLNSGIGGGGSSSAAAADALSNWHKRCHLTLLLLDALLSTLGRNLLSAPGLLPFVQDVFMKFLLKNTRAFSSLAGIGAAGASGAPGGAGASTFHLALFSRSLALVQQALVLYRDAIPAQMEIVVQSVYLRIIGIKLTPPAMPSTPTTASGANGVAGTPSKGGSQASSSFTGAPSQPLDPAVLSSLYDLQECVLESLLDLLSSSWFLPELFVNFDCNVGTANQLGEEMMRAIVRGIFPATNAAPAASAGATGTAAASGSSEEAGEEGLLAASSVAASFAAAALAAGAPAHDGSPSSGGSSHSDGSSGGGSGFTRNHFLALRCVVENLKWIKLRAEGAAHSWGAAAKAQSSYTAPQSPVAGARHAQQQSEWPSCASASASQGESPWPSPSPAFSSAAAAAAAAAAAPGPHASLPEIATWLQFMECWMRAQPAFSTSAALAAAAAGTAPEGETAPQSDGVSIAADASDLPNSLFRCLHSARLTKRLLRSCIAQFNLSPTKGGLAGFQQSFGLLCDYAQCKKEFRKASVLSASQALDIDTFTRLLRCNSLFDKVAIGLFLAEPDMYSSHIRSRYCANNFRFAGMTIDDSLRMFLEAFRLPLEAQQIDRMMQAFAETYFNQNPPQIDTQGGGGGGGGLADADAVHTLAFSIIMLNTDLHNDLIKNKMTLAQFLSNNRGINRGSNVSPILLKSLYFSIKFNEIKMSGSGGPTISAASSAATELGGGGGGGEVNDALWSDVVAQSSRMWIAPHVAATPQQQQQARRYIRLDASDAQSREETHRAVMHLIESPSSIIPERLCSSIVPVCLPPVAHDASCGLSLASDVLPCLLPLYADYTLFSSFGSAALASVTVVFELFLSPHMVVRHESRTRREQEAARKRAAAKAAWEEHRQREWREQVAMQAAMAAAAAAANSSCAAGAGFSIHVSSVVASDVPSGSSMLAASRQSSTDSEYCTVSAGSSSADEGAEHDETAQSREASPTTTLHTSASYPTRLPGVSQAPNSVAASAATRTNHSASYESLSAMHSNFSAPSVVRSPMHESNGPAASASTSLVSVLYSSFDSLATLCALYPLRFQGLFDKVVQALARFIGLSSHRGIVAAMGASGPSGVGIGDLSPPMSRAAVLGNKYASLQGFGSNAKATLVTRWMFQVFLHRPLLLESVRASWNEILRIVLAFFYLEVLPQPTIETTAHQSAETDASSAAAASHAHATSHEDDNESPDWILTNLEDFVSEWNEKFGAFVGIGSGDGGSIAPNRRAWSAGKIRKDLLSCVPLASHGHRGSSRKLSSADRGLSDSSSNASNSGGGLGSSLLGLFFSSSSSPPPGQEIEAPFHKSVDMASHELSLRALVSSCNLPFILLEQSRSLSLPALKGMLAHMMELSVIRGVAAQNWTPSAAAREKIAAQRMAQRTAMVAERHRSTRPSMLQSSNADVPSPTSAAAAAVASSRGSVLASLGLFEFDVLDEGLYVDLGEEAHIAHTLATNPQASLANLSPAHELGMHLQSGSTSSGSGVVSPLCSDCGVLDYLSLPFELRRGIFLLDLATKITMENGARIERMWGPIRKWMMGIIQGTAANAGAGAASGPGNQPVLLVSAAVVSLLSILTHLFHKENMREDLMHTLRAIIGPSSAATATAATGAAASGATSVPTAPSSRLDYFLSHSDICVQLVTGVHLFLARHADSLRSSHDWECIVGFIRATAEYPRGIFHGFALLWSLVKSTEGCDEGACPPAVTLHTFALLIDTVLAFVRSRYASPRMALKAVALLETLYGHLRTLLAASASALDGSDSGQESSGSNSPRGSGAGTGMGARHPFMARGDSQTSMIFSPTMAAAGTSGCSGSSAAAASVSSSPRLLLSHVWKSYCKPLLLALRCVSACATDRVRVLYNTYHFLQRQRAQQEHAAAAAAANSMGFGLLRSSPPPAAQPAHHGPPVPLSDYVLYMVEWARVRHQCLLLLKSTLISDEFASCVSDCVAQFGANHAAGAVGSATPVAVTPSSASTAAANSWECSSAAIASWCSACFWQLCLDETLFPLLRDLSVSASQSLFLETSAPFSLLRVGAVNLLSKVFLRQLPLLRQYNPAAGFATTWLTVLKTLDRYMQIGVHLQRQQTAQMQAMHHARATGHSHSSTHGPGGASSAGVPLTLLPVTGIDWSSESGLQLTESVAEALKNLVLVMRSQGVFDDDTQNTTAATTTATHSAQLSVPASAAASSSSSSSSSAPSPLPAPSGELWSLTVGMLAPWMPFLPALQAEIMTTEQVQQQQRDAQKAEATTVQAATEAADIAAPAATVAPAASVPPTSSVPPQSSSSPADQRAPTVL